MARLDCSPTSPAGERMARIVTETTPWRPAPQALPAGRTVFAIGDVHAHAEHLWALQEQIAGIIALEHDASDVTVVWLGDYVDRGWQPLQTLDLVAAGLGQPGVEEIRLLGNHEVYLIEAATRSEEHTSELQSLMRISYAVF